MTTVNYIMTPALSYFLDAFIACSAWLWGSQQMYVPVTKQVILGTPMI